MSINDPVVLYYYHNRNTWIFLQGRETFYDDDAILVEFDTREEAEAWANERGLEFKDEVNPRVPK